MKFIDFFAGIGGFRRGMELAGHECVGFCEFDKFATASYISMHLLTEEQRKALEDIPIKKRQKEILKEEYRNGEWYANDIRRVYAGDIPKADSDSSKKKINPLTFSLRTLKICLVLMEDGISPDCSLKWSSGGGYDAEWQVLNSKDFGVPQNRERCFIIGHLRGRSTSKVFPIEGTDGKNSIQIIAHKNGYRRNTQVFGSDGITEALDTGQGGGRGHHVALPCFIDLSYKKTELTNKARCLQGRYNKGITNHKAEVSGVAIKVIGEVNLSQDGKVLGIDGIAKCHSAGHNNNPKIAIPVLTPDRAEKRQNGRRFKEDGEPMFTLTSQDRHGVAIDPLGVLRNVRTEYGKEIRKDYESGKLNISRHEFLANEIREDGIANTLSTVQKDNQLAVKVAEATKQGYSECRVGIDAVNLSVPGSKTRRGRVGKEVANTLDTSCNQGIFVKVSDELTVYAVWYEKYQCYIAIRKLTPKECFRLQGWSDDYFEKAQFVNSDSQLYKQAGNGVTVTVIEAIARKMNVNLN